MPKIDQIISNSLGVKFKLEDGEVTSEKIADGAIGPDQMDPSLLHSAVNNVVVEAKFADFDAKLDARGVNVKRFGAKGDLSVDDTAAFQAAIAAVGYLGTIYVPKGQYKITAALDFRSRRVVGGGMDQTSIIQYTASAAVVMTGGVMCYLGDITIRHSDRNAALAQTVPAGVGILVNKMGYGSVIERCEIKYNSSGIYQNDPDNWMFSSTIRDCTIGQFSHSGLYSKGSNTGCVLDNIYIVNWDVTSSSKLPAKWGMFFQTCAQNTMRQINVEHGLYETGIEAVDCPGFVMESVHFEGFDPKTNGGSLCSLVKTSFHSNVIMNGFSFTYSKIDSANLTNFCMFQIADNSTIEADGIDIHDITLTGTTTRRRLNAGGTLLQGANINIDNMQMDTNIFGSPDSIDASYTFPRPLVTTTARQAYDNPTKLVIGSTTLYSELRGSEVYSGDGSTPTRNIAHGLGATPSVWFVQPATSATGTAGIKHVSADNVNLYVNFNEAPASGTNNVRLNWIVKN